jgi:hypothetical protein
MSHKRSTCFCGQCKKEENKFVLPKIIQIVHNGVGHIYVFKMILLCIIK